MIWKSLRILIFAISIPGMMLAACQFGQPATENDGSEPEIVATLAEPTLAPESMIAPLPERSGPRTQTSGTVPHVQIGVEPVPAVNDELFRLAFTLPGVEDRPTIVSLPGARGMWLSDDIPLAHPEAIVSGREFAHIHPDGSLHAPLPYERALEVAEKGWGERHPWADEREGWDGLVMLFTPQSMAELEIIYQLIVESYNHVTGQTLQTSDF
ncbi:MAG: phospholipase [Deltaproteobacteria bacterium]|jgi:phospholipase/carboxylesterase|nr:phospholipase [Deltaproteobacteria bacterium]